MLALIKYALSMLAEHDISEAVRLTDIIQCNAAIIEELKQTLQSKSHTL